MRHGSDERIAVTSALASMLAALTLAPLVSGYTWVFVAAITVVAAMVTGIVARQLLRWWPAVVAVQALVLLVTLVVLFARSRVVEGPGALGLLRDLLQAGLQVTREQAPPVEATQGIILLVAGSAGLIAITVDLLAATLRQPALAGLPLLAVYCVPAALLDGGLPWYYFCFAAAGFLLLLTADSGDRVRGWGRVLAAGASGRATRGPSDGGMARGGRVVGGTALALAVLVPTLVPGLGNQIIGGSGSGDGPGGNGRTITRINPILDLRRDLSSPEDSELLRYTTQVEDPEPLRIVTSDIFDGRTWSPSTDPIPRSQKAGPVMPPPPGLSDSVETTPVRTNIRIGPLNETYLPLPYPATELDVRGDWLYDEDTLNVIGDGVTTRGLDYSVQHLLVAPTSEQLAQTRAPDSAVAAKYRDLPPDLPEVIRATASNVAKDGSDYQRAVRLQRWFRTDGNFTYSLQAPENRQGDSSASAMADFLQQKRGYCVHFAATMAVMARSLGIPARVAVGFLPGERQADGSMSISAHDAHAWPELYFEGVGWTRFEPTPRAGLTTPPAWSIPPSGVMPEDPAASASEEPESSSSASAAAPSSEPRRVDEASPDAATADSGPGFPWRGALVVLAVLIGLSAPRAAATLASRRRWNRARTLPELAEAGWNDLRQELSDLGVRWAVSWTPRAVERRLIDDYAFDSHARPALERLTAEIENARYAPPSEELGRTAEERREDVATVVSTVASRLPDRTRWQARLWPRSGVERLAGLGPWMNLTADRAGRQATALGTQVKGRVSTSAARDETAERAAEARSEEYAQR